ncbi:MAG: hypothetical protein PHS92_03035 [Candidatus Gracilibacteria bacterium]|nr:hypothetical protein [Candidatus Gracilibacteria bacterium]
MRKLRKISVMLVLSLYLLFGSSSAFAISFNGQELIDNFKSSLKNNMQGKGIKTNMLVGEQNDNLITGDNHVDLSLGVNKNNVNFSDNFIKVIEKYIFGLVGVIAVSVFIYIAYMLFTAEGKEDEMKKAVKALTYAIVGLAIIPLSYVVIKIVTGFNF